MYDEAYFEPEDAEVLVQDLAGDGRFSALSYAHPGDAGLDLMTSEDFTLAPFERRLVSTGIAIALPSGYFALICPRSGLAARSGVTILNGPGVVDAGYRGEIKVPLINLDPATPVEFHAGDRIAQMIIQRFVKARLIPADMLPGSERGEKGFGSTGM